MRIRKDLMDNEDYVLIAKASDALSHPARVAIFRYIYNKNLAREEVCNKDIVSAFSYSQSTISQHMNKLHEGQLVDILQKGNKNCYYVNLGQLGKFLDTVKKLNR